MMATQKEINGKDIKLIDGKVLVRDERHQSYRDKLNGLRFRKIVKWNVWESEENYVNDDVWAMIRFDKRKQAIEYIKE